MLSGCSVTQELENYNANLVAIREAPSDISENMPLPFMRKDNLRITGIR